MTTQQTNLYGSCACERNQYAISIPQNHSHQTPSHAHVFFDNSRATRRSQAAPLTAWLHIPLAWYHSSTQAFFPDESHASIRRTFYTPASLTGSSGGREIRKQFCGYCGTHLNAWRDGEGSEEEGEGQWMDVTLGSLWGESLGVLEGLGWLGGESSEEDEEEEDEGPGSGRDGRVVGREEQVRNQGMPFFEEMVRNSGLGRVKRQRGGFSSEDGRARVEWVVEEIESGEGEDAVMRDDGEVGEGGNGNKRLKLGD